MTPLEQELRSALAKAADMIAEMQENGCPVGPVAVPSQINDALAKYRRFEAAENCEITTSYRTLWVNSQEGWCIARFAETGIDIHSPIEVAEQNGQCLQCTHEYTALPHWQLFQESMLRLYGVVIPDDKQPGFVAEVDVIEQRRRTAELRRRTVVG